MGNNGVVFGMFGALAIGAVIVAILALYETRDDGEGEPEDYQS